MADKIDLQILKILKEDGRKKVTEIGKDIGLSEAAVRKRITAMTKSGIINGFSVKLGKKAITALIYISREKNENSNDFFDNLKKMTEVLTVYRTTSETDYVLHCAFLSIEHFNSFVDNISALDGVIDTKSKLILRES